MTESESEESERFHFFRLRLRLRRLRWVESYTLQSSTDGTTWADYEENGQVKVVEVKGYIY